jgi:hypothetical protein
MNDLKLLRKIFLCMNAMILISLIVFQTMKGGAMFMMGIVFAVVILVLLILLFAPPPSPNRNKQKQPHKKRDKCQFCLGEKGGKPGNENMIDGVITCDYCQSLLNDIDAAREESE